MWSPNLDDLKDLSILKTSADQLTCALSQTLTQLPEIETIWFDDTDLCEPPDDDFQDWLDGIEDLTSTGVVCGS